MLWIELLEINKLRALNIFCSLQVLLQKHVVYINSYILQEIRGTLWNIWEKSNIFLLQVAQKVSLIIFISHHLLELRKLFWHEVIICDKIMVIPLWIISLTMLDLSWIFIRILLKIPKMIKFFIFSLLTH